MAFAYRNDGFSMRAVDPTVTTLPDEVVFADYATEAQLAAAFPNRASATAQIATDAAAAMDAANIGAITDNPRMAKAFLALVNAIRTLQGKQTITAAQLRDWILSL